MDWDDLDRPKFEHEEVVVARLLASVALSSAQRWRNAGQAEALVDRTRRAAQAGTSSRP